MKNLTLGDLILDGHERNTLRSILITTSGMCEMGILKSYIKKYAKKNKLTVILNFNKDDANFYKEKIFKSESDKYPIEIFENKVKEKRQKTYSRGGVVFTSSLIFILDLLGCELSADIVNNLFIFKGENFDRNSTCFLLDFLREKSFENAKPENIIIFSKNSDKLSLKAEKISQELKIENFLFWPIYKMEIKKSILEQKEIIEEIELAINLDKFRVKLQNNIISIIDVIEKKIATKFGIDIKEIYNIKSQMLELENEVIWRDYLKIKSLLNDICEGNFYEIIINFFNIFGNLNNHFYNLIEIKTKLIEKTQNLLINHVFNYEKINQELDTKKYSKFFDDEKIDKISHKVIIKLGTNLKFKAIQQIIKNIREKFEICNSPEINVLITCNTFFKKSSIDLLFFVEKNEKLKFLFISFQLLFMINHLTIKNNYLKNKKKEFQVLIKILYKFFECLQIKILEWCGNSENCNFQNILNFLYFNEKIDKKENLYESEDDEKEEEEEILDADCDNLNRLNNVDVNINKDYFNEKKTEDIFQNENNFLKKKIQNNFNLLDYEDVLDFFEVYYQNEKIDFKNLFKILISMKKDNKQKNDLSEEKEKLFERKNEKSIEVENNIKDFKINENNTNQLIYKLKNNKEVILNIETIIIDNKSNFKSKFFRSNIDMIIFYDLNKDFLTEIKLIPSFFSHSEKIISLPKEVYTIYIKNSIQSDRFYQRIKNENINFDKIIKIISENKKTIILSKKIIKKKEGLIIIDKREFNSQLPFRLYKKGYEIKPLLLNSADYIISDRIGIERKDCETGDFLTSLKSGRLLKQLKKMEKHFNKVYLLIENYDSLPFCPYFELFKILRKCRGVLLIWSKNLDESISLIKFLRRNLAEPDPLKLTSLLI